MRHRSACNRDAHPAMHYTAAGNNTRISSRAPPLLPWDCNRAHTPKKYSRPRQTNLRGFVFCPQFFPGAHKTDALFVGQHTSPIDADNTADNAAGQMMALKLFEDASIAGNKLGCSQIDRLAPSVGI